MSPSKPLLTPRKLLPPITLSPIPPFRGGMIRKSPEMIRKSPEPFQHQISGLPPRAPENARLYKDLLPDDYTYPLPEPGLLAPIDPNGFDQASDSPKPRTDSPLILTRLYFRLLPALAEEPSSTLLLVTPGSRFVDIRLSRTQPTTLLWGSSGTYYRTSTSGLRGHSIDSRTTRPESHYHVLRTQANGDIHQSGERSTDGRPYEEVWRASAVTPRVVVVLALRSGKGKGAVGCVVRVGGWCQGIVKVGGDTTVERWMRGADVRWKRVARVGKEVVPCGVACLDRDESGQAAEHQGARYWKEAVGAGFAVVKTVGVGDTLRVGKWEWEVVERENW
ncbi:hypothetical protein EDC01DRAFT_221973 [Geopyxis carbonaria]|nr:hypothetical protein EDC01DRAFT_221973 [Geopyxis carbonaria]